MLVRRLTIQHFRGISDLSWDPPPGVVCLVGPGDTGKTTILDALELVLSPRWGHALHDRDFTGRDVSQAIVIEATVTDLPEDLFRDDRFGIYLRGWATDGTLNDEPEQGDEAALTVRFTVDDSLEPSWVVVNGRCPEGVTISARNRERLGMGRVGTTVDAAFRWTRGTALARLSGAHDEVSRVLTDANRRARDAVAEADLSGLDEAVDRARTGATDLAAGEVAEALHAALEDTSATGGPRLALHSGDLPLPSYGLGTRRLVAMGLQLAVAEGASLLLLDELEHGLEPYRVRRLVRSLRDRVADTASPVRQAIITTHSRVAVEQFTADELHVVHREGERTVRLQGVGEGLQHVARSQAESFLAKQVLVCEGKTETGLCLGLDAPATPHFDPPLSHRGVVPSYGGGGDKSAGVARDFARLGYRVALFADSDQPLNPSPDELRAEGVEVVQWAHGMATEDRVAHDLPLKALDALVNLAEKLMGPNISILDDMGAKVAVEPPYPPPSAWVNAHGIDEGEVRNAAADVLKTRRAFKDFDRAEQLAPLLIECWGELDGSDLRRKLERLDAWAERG